MRPVRLFVLAGVGLTLSMSLPLASQAEPVTATNAPVPSSTPAQPAVPATCPICGRAGNPATYADKAGTTLVRGASNTLFGWTELLRQPVQEAKAGGNVFVGIGKGLGESVMRTFAGAGEILTFWTPKTKDGYVQFSTDCPICMKSSR